MNEDRWVYLLEIWYGHVIVAEIALEVGVVVRELDDGHARVEDALHARGARHAQLQQVGHALHVPRPRRAGPLRALVLVHQARPRLHLHTHNLFYITVTLLFVSSSQFISEVTQVEN